VLKTPNSEQMLIIIEPKTGEMKHYSTLKEACKCNKWMSYHYLTNKKIDNKLTIYKNMWIYRVIINR
jgi:hypothetical protein